MSRKAKAPMVLTPDRLKTIEEMKSKGATVGTICDTIGIGRSTYYKWMKNHDGLKTAHENGEQAQIKNIDAAIETRLGDIVDAFFKLLLGYKDTEVKVERYKLNGKVVENDAKFPIKETITTKVIQPNAALLIFFLKCKFGWAEKSVVEMQGQPVNNPMAEMTVEDLRKLVNLYGKDKH
jgi:hypothetical protein